MGVSNAVNHPDYYQMGNGLEAIDIVESVTYKLKGIEANDMGDAIKNMCKWANEENAKDNDLENAIWYLQHLLAHRRSEVKKQIDEVTNQMMTGGIQ